MSAGGGVAGAATCTSLGEPVEHAGLGGSGADGGGSNMMSSSESHVDIGW